MIEIQMLVGGERRSTSSGAAFERRNPLDHNVATRAPAASTADAVAAVDASHMGLHWARRAPQPPSEGIRCTQGQGRSDHRSNGFRDRCFGDLGGLQCIAGC